MSIENSLVCLALLKVNWDEKGADYIENFVPFIGEALRLSKDDAVSIPELQKITETEFGLLIPQGALRTILNRAARKNYVSHINGIYVRNLTSIPNDFAREKQRATRILKTITTKFISYCKSQHNVSLTDPEAETIFLEFIQKTNVPILETAIHGAPLKITPNKSQKNDFLIASFLLFLNDKDEDGFKLVETITKGQMIATLLFLPDIGKVQQKFEDLTIYLDTRIILRALGLEGEEYTTQSHEFLKIMRHMNVNIACFSQTHDEIRGILDSVAHSLQDKSRKSYKSFSVLSYAISQGWRSSDIESIISTLEITLKRLRIYIKEKPQHSSSLGLNEEKLTQILNVNLPRQSTEAQHHDIDCLTSIHRLRNAQPRYNIENCNHIFVTSNNDLARASTIFFIEEYAKNTVPLCINDHTLATLAWVKNPQYVQNLSTQMLISDSHAAMRPNRELWNKYLHEIERLHSKGDISDDDFNILRFSMAARNALLESTLATPDAFTEGTVPIILERAHQNITDKMQGKLDKAVATTEKAVLDFHTLAMSQTSQLSNLAEGIGKTIRWGSIYILFSLAVIGLLLTLPEIVIGIDINKFSTNKYNLIMEAIILAFSILVLFHLLFGKTVWEISINLEIWTTKMANKILAQVFLPENHPYKQKQK
ncbi:MAG TPA: hypothetical protein VMW01_16120 [Williamwhitmania sp.]|nr:hypothetical protein [Williamwhitmania sp.]